MQSPHINKSTMQICHMIDLQKNNHIGQVSNDISQLPRTHMLVVMDT